MSKIVTVRLTELEAHMVAICLIGEVENDDGNHGNYMTSLRRVIRKLRSAGVVRA